MACCCELQNTLDVEVTQDALLDVEIGGSAGVLLQAKSVEITENGTRVVAPDDGFDGLKIVEINTNVPKRFECGDGYFLPITSAQKNLTLISRLQKMNISCWDVSSYTSMNSMFNGYSSLQSLDVSGWDTAGVTNMSSMFNGCSSLKQLDVSGWYTSSVTNMGSMFNSCSSLKQLDVSGWDTAGVTNMSSMFNGCSSLKQLDVSGWDTSSVTNMDLLFAHCYKLQYIDVSNWNTSKVKSMASIFSFCYLFDLLDISGWEASSATATTDIFRECHALRSIIGNKTLQDVENGTVALRGTKVNIKTNYSPLRFSSILALVNGLADLTGGTAQTLTISKNSYNNMYNDDDTKPTAEVISERQARIAAICAAKNWNFAH